MGGGQGDVRASAPEKGAWPVHEIGGRELLEFGAKTRSDMVTEEREGATVSRHLSLAAVDRRCDRPESQSQVVTRSGLMASSDSLTYLTRRLPMEAEAIPTPLLTRVLWRAPCRCEQGWRTDPQGQWQVGEARWVMPTDLRCGTRSYPHQKYGSLRIWPLSLYPALQLFAP